MATHSLHRNANSPYYLVSFRLPDPNQPGVMRQCTRSTKQKTKSEAEKAARNIVAAAEKEAGAGTEKGRAIYAILQEAAKLAEDGKLNLAMGTVIVGKLIEASGGAISSATRCGHGFNTGWTGRRRKRPSPEARAKRRDTAPPPIPAIPG